MGCSHNVLFDLSSLKNKVRENIFFVMCFDWGSHAMKVYDNNKTNASELFCRKAIKIKWKINCTVTSGLVSRWISKTEGEVCILEKLMPCLSILTLSSIPVWDDQQ